MNLPLITNTRAVEETEILGRQLAEYMLTNKTPNFVAMYGDLGVGKTAFVRGFCSVFSPAALVRSPTFALVNDYRCDNAALGHKHIYHFDMYRITSEDDLISCGFFDYENCIIATEWSENIEYALPSSYYRVNIQKDDTASNTRMLTISLIQQEA